MTEKENHTKTQKFIITAVLSMVSSLVWIRSLFGGKKESWVETENQAGKK